MKTNVKILSLVDVVSRQQGAFLLRLIHVVFGVALSLFFRRIAIVGEARMPEKSGLIYVSNHPNALIDPALLFIALPRRIAFLAKSTLFQIPILGLLIRVVGALPLYRQQDAGADVSKNQKTFEIARELLKSGGAIAIFPEGVSHNAPRLMPLKTGAARIALGTVSVGKNPGALDVKIVPIGLFYTNKTTFRSEALIYFGEPINVSPVELDTNGQPPKDTVVSLTALIENGLREVTVNAESEAKFETARVASEVLTIESGENLSERLDFLQNFVAATDEILEKRLAEYDRKLNELGTESEFLALAEYSGRFVFKHALIRSWYLILFAPLAFVGVLLHFPAYQICKLLAFLQTRKGDFDMASTVKVLAGMVLMPATWLAAAGVVYFYFGWQIALFSIPFSAACGYAALRTLEETEELLGWATAILLFFGKREKFLRLLAERRNLRGKMVKMENGKLKAEN
jgi:1-acyl-sn-glycerol-3-phosphate acyltransferase